MKHTTPPIIVEQVFKATCSQVWNAITKHEEMTLWYLNNIPEFITESCTQGSQYFIQQQLKNYLEDKL